MRKTVLNEVHKALGARMVEFAGYEMPVEYSGITSEHNAVRSDVGIFDVSHMGEFYVEGENAVKYLQRITSNNIEKIKIGKAQYNLMLNERGGVIDDLLVYRLKESRFLLVVNASNRQKDFDWCQSKLIPGVNLSDKSDDISLLAVQGPKALSLLQRLTKSDLSKVPFYSFIHSDFAGVENVLLSNTGYTGSGGFEIYCSNSDCEAIWRALIGEGEEFGLVPAGLGARDTLRLEKGLCLHGNDLDETTTPIEAGLSFAVKIDEGNDFIGKKIVVKQKKEGVKRRLRGFAMQERGIPRKGYEILNSNGDVIGTVTSGSVSPGLNKGIGMGYIKNEDAYLESEIFIRIRKRLVSAIIVKTPFV
ncbi:glycine cleavage system aminomethyltransferase GcvT [Marinilabiliaceae bacterium ANBcel2]|nr:glycine cleavage system aminomethyltransferase GcvT [Marinilabiliaceae bacterium ANBcel2]